MHPITVLLVVGTLCAPACSVFMPPRPKAAGAQPNGQPLVLREDVIHEREKYRERVATIRDDRGRTLADVYEEGTRIQAIPVWYGYQGDELLDAEDFFRIAGDEDARDDVESRRTLAYVANRGGWISAIAGVGLVFLTASLPEDAPGRTGIFVTGLGSMCLGVSAGVWGAKNLAPERHGVSSLRASMAAGQYNAGLGREASNDHRAYGITMSGSL